MIKIPPIHPNTIESVKDRAQILEIVGAYVVLKRKGKDYLGLCPFHQEKSPSFSVSPAKNMYYCFGCQAGGDPISFVSKITGKSFPETIVDLAGQYGIEIQTLEPEQTKQLTIQLSRRERIYTVLDLTCHYYQQQLNSQTTSAKLALDYLTTDRRLSTATIQSWQLGLAADGWKSAIEYLTKTHQIPIETIVAAGLAIPNKDNTDYYDRFRSRLTIPIRDRDGRIIGFGARTLTNEQPKYLNSPETELFSKGQTLFGLDRARTQITKRDRAIVVEGYFDVISLHTAGITNVVAAQGTALSIDQIRQLAKLTNSNQIILNFDGDGAGQLATDRAITATSDLIYNGQIQLRIVNLPSGKDADEYLRSHTATDYRSLLDRAPLWLDWQLRSIITDCDFTQADRFIYASSLVVELLAKITDPTTRIFYIQTAAGLLSNGNSRSISQITNSLTNSINLASTSKPTLEIQLPTRSLSDQTEGLLLAIYLQYPHHRLEIIDRIDTIPIQFINNGYDLLWQAIVTGSHTYNDPDLATHLTHVADLNSDVRLLLYNPPTEIQDPTLVPDLLKSILNTLHRIALESHISDLVKRLSVRSIDNNQQELHLSISLAKAHLIKLV